MTSPAASATSARRQTSSGRRVLLALSLHGDDCSVALGTAAGAATAFWSRQPERSLPGARIGADQGPLASRDALMLLDRLLARAGTSLAAVDGLCFAHGPGAFTSLRVAAGIVQGLSLALSRPVTGICSLAAMAAQAPGWREPEGPSWLQFGAIDARMGECYYAVHRCRGGRHPETVLAPRVGKPAEAISAFERVIDGLPGRGRPAGRHGHDSGIAAAGNAFALAPALADWAAALGCDVAVAAARTPSADAVLALAESDGAPAAGPAESAVPVYVRDKVALDVDEQRQRGLSRARRNE